MPAQKQYVGKKNFGKKNDANNNNGKNVQAPRGKKRANEEPEAAQPPEKKSKHLPGSHAEAEEKLANIRQNLRDVVTSRMKLQQEEEYLRGRIKYWMQELANRPTTEKADDIVDAVFKECVSI
ncbi:hypothetical protein V8C35DRAFT_313724 [Trichoderma chlorosporum]